MNRLFRAFLALSVLIASPLAAQMSFTNPGATGGGGSGTVTSVAVTTANGVSGTVANPTTTPAISVTLGAITPSSVAASGTVTGSNVSGTNTGDQTITLSGDASGSGTGAVAVTISGLSLSKLAAISNNTILGNVSGSSAVPSALTAAQTKTLLAISASDVSGLAATATSASATNLTGTLNAAQMPALTGDVTNSAGSLATTIANGAVTVGKMANLAATSLLGNATGSTAAPTAIGLGPSFTFTGSTLYGASDHPGYISGNWYSTVRGAGAAAGATFTANNIKLMPFTLSKPITISALGARVTTLASSGNFQLAIYANNAATGHPTGTALCTTGNISSNATGTISATATCTGALTPGTYWSGINQDNGTAVFQTVTPAEALGSYLIGSATLANISGSATNVAFNLTTSSTFNTWPDLTSASFTEQSSSTTALVFMKAQ